MSTQSNAPIRSQLANDPEMAELIELFLSDLGTRAASLQELWAARDVAQIARMAHQLRGASAGYGFPMIGAAAGEIEDALKHRAPGDVDLESIDGRLKELLSLCNRAIAGRS